MAGGAQETAAALRALLEPAVEAAGFDLEDLAVSRAGSRSVVRVAVDRDGGVDLDAVAAATRAISEVLDENEDAVAGAYALEVTSPGVDRPLVHPRHWRRATGRLVAVTSASGSTVTGRVTAADEIGATLSVEGVPTAVGYVDVRRAVVQVEFSRPAAAAAPGSELDDAADGDEYDEVDADDLETDEDEEE